MEIRFANGVTAWEDFKETVHRIIRQEAFKEIAEIGGGANPLLSLEFVEAQRLSYHVLDVSEEELSKAGDRYEKKILNLEAPEIEPTMQYDFIFAQMTLEHINNVSAFYRNVYKLLKQDGKAYFFFACVTSLPSITNLLIPDNLSEKVLLKLQPFRKHEKHGKFKAYYKWCFGPTQKNIARFSRLRFKILSYVGYFGHSYYQRIPFLHTLEALKTRLLLKRPVPYLCSYTHVLLKK